MLLYELAVKRFSDVMWSMQQIMFTSLDKRLAEFLVSESERTGSNTLRITHEQITQNISSAREAATRMLKSFFGGRLGRIKPRYNYNKGLIIIKRYIAMKITVNQDEAVVKTVREGLKRTGGYCPCRLEQTEDTKCMCKEFKEQIADPNFEGFCHCMLYYKSI